MSSDREQLIQKKSMFSRLREAICGQRNDLPSSLPDNWPNSTAEDIELKGLRQIRIGAPQEFAFRSNFVKTSKYDVWSFLPKFLLEEFNPRTKVANCYFLLISALQCIPEISNTSGYPTTMIPLTFVVVVDAIFQIIEDMSRHRADLEANSSITHIYNSRSKSFEDIEWSRLRVGDLVRVQTRESIPADIIVLGVAEKSEHAQGMCYVETKSLDGETNLKLRHALPNTYQHVKDTPPSLGALKGYVEMEHPNKLIESFTGVIELEERGKMAIQPTNVLLRGCVLRNTDWVIGLVANTGHDTKIMMSSRETKGKSSNLESLASIQIQRIIVMLAVVCFAGSTGQAIWNSVHEMRDIWYLDWDPNPVGYWFVKFFYFFLLHASFIPVSLYVSMSIARFYQSIFMNSDLSMYYEVTDSPALVRTMTLNEELGQISHIFSDKTGTLTGNVMDFRKMSINGVAYGLGITEIGKSAWKLQGKAIPSEMLEGEAKAREKAVPHVSFYCPLFEEDMQRGGKQAENILNFFRCLALCHDVIPERIDGKIKLSASNPDDEALVCAASYFGVDFVDRNDNNVLLHYNKINTDETVVLLASIPFTSKRKRMSVIIRDSDGRIRLICKGADNVIIDRMKPNQGRLAQVTEEHLNTYSTEGLRCLLVAMTEIPELEFNTWHAEYKRAVTDLSQIDKKKAGQPNLIDDLEEQIEKNLILLGATAIEDRLQAGVPESIAELADAGINIWMLTGDKEETAINIAVACNLVQPKEYMDHVIVNKHTAPDTESMRELFIGEIKKYREESSLQRRPRALIIDGPSLIVCHDDHMRRDGLRQKMLEFADCCQAVVGCRVSPDQKREMVHLVKLTIPGVRTLAIGDGANDVAMIQEAHVGVGIKGEEGLQAVNSADYAIAQFRFLSVLLLKHGRFNYIRMSSLVCYMFYKNIFMSISQFWFNFNCAFSGQKYYTEGAIQMFNLLYSSLPILFLGVYDMDISVDAALGYPKSYLAGVRHFFFNTRVFWTWVLHALVESVFVSVMSLYMLSNSDPRTGTMNTFWEAGALSYTAIIFIINIKILFIQGRYYSGTVGILLLSVVLWFISAFFINSFTLLDYDWFGMWNRLMTNGNYWLCLLLLVLTVFAKDSLLYGYERRWCPKPFHILQEMEVYETMAEANPEQLIGSPPPEGAAPPRSLNSVEMTNVTKRRGGKSSPAESESAFDMDAVTVTL